MSIPAASGYYLYTPDAARADEIVVFVGVDGRAYDEHLKPLGEDLPGTWRPLPLPVARIVVSLIVAFGALALLAWWVRQMMKL